jgi:hypothetical protein
MKYFQMRRWIIGKTLREYADANNGKFMELLPRREHAIKECIRKKKIVRIQEIFYGKKYERQYIPIFSGMEISQILIIGTEVI